MVPDDFVQQDDSDTSQISKADENEKLRELLGVFEQCMKAPDIKIATLETHFYNTGLVGVQEYLNMCNGIESQSSGLSINCRNLYLIYNMSNKEFKSSVRSLMTVQQKKKERQSRKRGKTLYEIEQLVGTSIYLKPLPFSKIYDLSNKDLKQFKLLLTE